MKSFHGKPIIAYSIDVALRSGLFDEVMVSTDDAEISEIAQAHGAQVPFMRSAETSTDFATTTAVLQEVVTQYKERNQQFDAMCCIYPTAPFITTERLAEGKELLSNHESVMPVVPFSYPVWRGLKRSPSGGVSFQWPEYAQTRSQDLSEVYHDAGQWYWFLPSALTHGIISDKTGSLVLSNLEVQDIDTPADWAIAELKYANLQATH